MIFLCSRGRARLRKTMYKGRGDVTLVLLAGARCPHYRDRRRDDGADPVNSEAFPLMRRKKEERSKSAERAKRALTALHRRSSLSFFRLLGDLERLWNAAGSARSRNSRVPCSGFLIAEITTRIFVHLRFRSKANEGASAERDISSSRLE